MKYVLNKLKISNLPVPQSSICFPSPTLVDLPGGHAEQVLPVEETLEQ